MQAAQIIGGYCSAARTLCAAPWVRKKPEEMVKHREIFAEGGETRHFARKKSDEIFNYTEKIRRYGFNKSRRCLRPDFLPDRMAQSPLSR